MHDPLMGAVEELTGRTVAPLSTGLIPGSTWQ
jgi:hypothetical protein